jgi:hypothetical protein
MASSCARTAPMQNCNQYGAPADWGTSLATWTVDGNYSAGPIGGVIDTTLNGSSSPFPKGVALQQWLTNVSALGQNGMPAGQLSIYQPRYNSVVTSADKASQPWITSEGSGMPGQTMYFSFDTPVNPNPATTGPDPGGGPTYCGRAVFSDLHVGGDPATVDTSPPPGGCQQGPLSSQEKALEFMLFDLSSCVIPDSVPPPVTVPSTPQ